MDGVRNAQLVAHQLARGRVVAAARRAARGGGRARRGDVQRAAPRAGRRAGRRRAARGGSRRARGGARTAAASWRAGRPGRGAARCQSRRSRAPPRPAPPRRRLRRRPLQTRAAAPPRVPPPMAATRSLPGAMRDASTSRCAVRRRGLVAGGGGAGRIRASSDLRALGPVPGACQGLRGELRTRIRPRLAGLRAARCSSAGGGVQPCTLAPPPLRRSAAHAPPLRVNCSSLQWWPYTVPGSVLARACTVGQLETPS